MFNRVPRSSSFFLHLSCRVALEFDVGLALCGEIGGKQVVGGVHGHPMTRVVEQSHVARAELGCETIQCAGETAPVGVLDHVDGETGLSQRGPHGSGIFASVSQGHGAIAVVADNQRHAVSFLRHGRDAAILGAELSDENQKYREHARHCHLKRLRGA